jgi:uncharacterized membrane protein YkgB
MILTITPYVRIFVNLKGGILSLIRSFQHIAFLYCNHKLIYVNWLVHLIGTLFSHGQGSNVLIDVILDKLACADKSYRCY